jgi:hypothetical protein
MYETPQQLKRAIEQNNSLQFSAILDRLLTDKSFDLDRSNECGRTLLGYAAEDNRVDIIKILLDRGADINSIDYPLHLAVEFDRPQTIDLLLDRGANIDRLDSNRSTPIALAASGMNANICLKLIERSADVNIADCLGLKPIHYALAWSLTDVIEAIGGSEFDRLDVFLCLETPPLTIDRSVDSELSELKRYVSNYSNLLAILINFFLLSPFQQSAIMPRLPAVTKFDFRDGDVETDSSLDVLCCGYEQILSNLIFSI